MQAITVSQAGGPEVMHVTERPIPTPRDGEVLVRVMAAGVGPWDVSIRERGGMGTLPYVPGGEFSGVVVGDTGASAFLDDGAPVYGYPGLTGCYAQFVTCPVEQLAPIPAGLSLIDAAAVPIGGLTAEQGITEVLQIKAGDRVLITAGAGGVGHFAVQIARALGAEVVATASPQHHEFLHKLGAAVVLDHTRADWPDRARDALGGGAQRVLACAEPSLDGAARAAADGAIIATPLHADFPDAQRVSWQSYNGKPRGTRLIALAPWFDDGTITVTVQARYDWQDVAQAHAAVAGGHVEGKIVLVVDDDLASEAQV
jgi:NADPH:quinone reductase-like Zn-dependent oxidoreductase